MSLTSVISSARRGHRALWTFGWLNAVAAIGMAIASVFDDRTVLGAPLWFKPMNSRHSKRWIGAGNGHGAGWVTCALQWPAGSVVPQSKPPGPLHSSRILRGARALTPSSGTTRRSNMPCKAWGE